MTTEWKDLPTFQDVAAAQAAKHKIEVQGLGGNWYPWKGDEWNCDGVYRSRPVEPGTVLYAAPPPNAEDAKLLQQCRSSVAFDLREMERLILRKGEACNQCDHDEANRLLTLLEAIDARGEGNET